jgi:hypothetical protein
MDEQLFKKYYNQELGVSFFYDSLLVLDGNDNELGNSVGLCLRHGDFQFKLLKLSPEANIGLRYFGLENGLRSSLDKNEIIIEDLNTERVRIDGSKIAQTTTILPKEGNNFKVKRYLLSQDGQGYLLAFQDTVEKFDLRETQSRMENIIETIKLFN